MNNLELEIVWTGTMEREGTAPRLSFWDEDMAALRAGQLRPDFKDRQKASQGSRPRKAA
jgi:hypothetical protein